MQNASINSTTLHFEPAEAGRYDAKLLIFPGLFQSYACWRPFTSMLAHRGWEVYLLSRRSGTDDGAQNLEPGLADLTRAAAQALDRLGENVIFLGADVGAAMALQLCRQRRPMALALFAPCLGEHIEQRLGSQYGFRERRRLRNSEGALQPSAAILRGCRDRIHVTAEPQTWFRELCADSSPTRPEQLPPAIVFAPTDDSLVDSDHALSFADGRFARASAQRLAGRWWPAAQGPSVADEVHRFLILTLADRVVDFPEEVIGE